MKIKENRKQIVAIILIFILLSIIWVIYMTYMLDKIEKNAINSIQTIVKNDANNLKKEISEQKEILDYITEQIRVNENISIDEIFDMYEESDITSNFIRMAIMYEDGKTITNDGHNLNYFDEKDNIFSNRKIHVSENRISKIDGNQINIYSKVVDLKKEKIAILLIVKTDSYKDTFSNKIFEGNGTSFIVDNEGKVVVSPVNTANEDDLKAYVKENGVNGTNIIQTKDGKLYMVYEKNWSKRLEYCYIYSFKSHSKQYKSSTSYNICYINNSCNHYHIYMYIYSCFKQQKNRKSFMNMHI